ncbi:DHA2 family efflux MFS transporter permease subunit [Salinisphaera aquimarina]|uniref:DHA2 family efflux MFS transporter permease subunit n=1 Tax=Salinisphaera aquimarina TaxID=2094031 RepID=A0ABV7EVX6_9GAMM
MSAAQGEQERPPLSTGALVLVTLSLALAVFMNVLDVSIANVSIPTIAGNLGVSTSQGTWVITSFAVANAIAVPVSGWMAKRVGEVKLFIWCTVLFTLFSFLCGISGSFVMLLVMRAAQGVVAGPMIPLSQSLLLVNYPPEKRGFANGIWGMTAVVGPVAGPILGGWITDNISWSWIFYINVPVGIFAAAGTWFVLRNRETETERLPLDLIGLALLIVGVGALQVMLDKGNDEAWFQSQFIVILAVTATVFLSFFVVWELTDDNPVVDLKLFGRRNFTVATLCVTLGFMTYFAGVVLLPLWLQNEQGYTPTWAGITTASLGLMGAIFSPIVGRLTDKIDIRFIVTFGMLLFALLSFIKADANTEISFQRLFLTRLPWGIGLACFFIPLITLSLSGLPSNKVASASGLFNFMRLIALSFGTSLSVTLWDRRQAYHDHVLSTHTGASDVLTQQWLTQAQAQGMSQQQSYGALAEEILKQSFMIGLNEMYFLAGCVFIGLTVLIWFSRPNQ